ncbi:MAG TPA: hypothetical protein DDX39_12230 [Bacteroidales bacterium]|nr:MAG: hypothetical protein A2W98_11635 [Bacteroidetes bacterium GWF2_33_38]OFY75537.1 MAG: hypothetical protein A2265_03060 [Bacteroidetes bacterium RIFOXYA12_FULL_33_9]OFY88840.1 MAG: hypothetical protein A2236_08505 [Bacteroidetes bacterium RIFOXYA2_FULL_33_7]HBF89400.1 hypothetical protein [Bacteroidales bacterium]
MLQVYKDLAFVGVITNKPLEIKFNFLCKKNKHSVCETSEYFYSSAKFHELGNVLFLFLTIL